MKWPWTRTPARAAQTKPLSDDDVRALSMLASTPTWFILKGQIQQLVNYQAMGLPKLKGENDKAHAASFISGIVEVLSLFDRIEDGQVESQTPKPPEEEQS